FKNIPRMFLLCNLTRHAKSNITGEGHIEPVLLEQMVGKQRGCSFAVGTCNRNDARLRVSERELDLINNRNTPRGGCPHKRSVIRNAGTLAHKGRAEHLLLRMAALLECDPFLRQFLPIAILNRAPVGHEHVESPRLRQKCSPCAAFASAQYDYLFTHRNFSVANVKIARSIPTIQKRVTIFASWMFFF